MTEKHCTIQARPVLAVLLLLPLLTVTGCRPESEESVSDRDINTVLESNASALMSIPGVTAVAIGQTADGSPCIKIYVTRKTDELAAKLPETLDGFPVVIEESGEFKPMNDG